jgi:hypothetical protein
MGPITAEERKRLIQSSTLAGHYERAADRESAYEILKRRAETPPEQTTSGSRLEEWLGGGPAKGGRRREGMAEAMMKSASRAIGSQIGRQLIRGVLGSLLGGKR